MLGKCPVSDCYLELWFHFVILDLTSCSIPMFVYRQGDNDSLINTTTTEYGSIGKNDSNCEIQLLEIILEP